MRLALLVGVALSVACGPEAQNSLFGVGTQGQTTTGSGGTASGSTGPNVATTSGADGSAEGVSADTIDPTTPGSSEGSGDTGSPTTGLQPETTSSTSTDATTGSSEGTSSSTGAGEESSSSSSTGAGDEEEDDGAVGPGMQPGDGMYAACVEPEDCGFIPELCISLSDGDGVFLGGFCSETTCNDPIADCDPAPGEAPAACMPATVDGAADSVCVLDCTGGEACPAGMTCYALAGISICS